MLAALCQLQPADWSEAGSDYDESATTAGLGHHDYGLGRFAEVGFGLSPCAMAITTIQNTRSPMPKILMLYPGQTAPLHFHWSKMEDIINRGGNVVYITVYNGAEDGIRLDTDVVVHLDGREMTVPAGTQVKLSPGESIAIDPYLYHDFIVPVEGGPVLLGEVSMCNDDDNDNRFYEPIGRFPKIEEDEAPYRLLCTEYPAAKVR